MLDFQGTGEWLANGDIHYNLQGSVVIYVDVMSSDILSRNGKNVTM
jgi:hypothetical protein